MFFEAMHISWQQALASQRSRLESLEQQLQSMQAQGAAIAPPLTNVMAAFAQPFDQVKVLIVGQDPYPTEGHAVGLSFAVSSEVKSLPKSLKNMMTELADDLPDVSHNGDLRRWSAQGVLLLNRHLTTEVGNAGAHSKLGWNLFTDAVIEALSERSETLVAVLWGKQAAELKPLLKRAIIIESAHPSPLSAYRGFFGSKPFSKANRALLVTNQTPIDWSC